MTPAGRRLVAFGLAFALLTMPVSYRAGTDVAHPHSFIQFLSEAAAGSMNHHLQSGGGYGEVSTPAPVSINAAPPGVPALDQLGPVNERSSALAIGLLAAWLAWAVASLAVPVGELKLVGIVPGPPKPPPELRIATG
jgi:hypothetical protein